MAESKGRASTAHLELSSSWHILLELQENGVDRVELAALFGVCEDLMSLLDALEEGIVVGVLVHAGEV